MTVTNSMLMHYMGLADREARIEAGKPQCYGGDPMIAGLRAFVRYHKDARQDVEMGGRVRSLTHKQVAMHGLITRMAVTGERGTITALAKEAHVVPSTLSRFLLKLQVWNVFAIDVKRGRNGGLTVRLRTLGDGLRKYAERAWERIRKAYSRTKTNVASSISHEVEVPNKVPVLMDATFSGATRGQCPVRGCDCGFVSSVPFSTTSREADEAFARAEAWATDVLRERALLATDDPWGELEAEYPIGWARELRHGVG